MSAANASPPVVLSVGHDVPLLLARNEVLRSGGYLVIPAINRYQALLAADHHAVTLAVFCHTITDDEAELLAHDLDLMRPGIGILRLRDYPDLAVREAAVSAELMLGMVRAALRGTRVH